MQPNDTQATTEQPASSAEVAGPATVSPPKPAETGNRIWSKTINTSNIVTAIIALLLLAFVDYPMAMSGWAMLGSFFQLMLIAFAVFVPCAIIDYLFSLKLRDAQKSRKDSTILTFVMIRNFTVILNVIPLVQLFGMLAALFAPAIIIAQLIVMTARLKEYGRESRSI